MVRPNVLDVCIAGFACVDNPDAVLWEDRPEWRFPVAVDDAQIRLYSVLSARCFSTAMTRPRILTMGGERLPRKLSNRA